MHLTGFQKRIYQSINAFPLARMGKRHFDDLALETFYWQFERNAVYRRFCIARNMTRPRSWHEIPCLPVSVFKHARVICDVKHSRGHQFKTSGTTHSKRGVHYFPTRQFYDAAIASLLAKYLLRPGRTYAGLSLVRSFSEAPDSSLSYMIHVAAARFEMHPRYCAFRGQRVYWDHAVTFIRRVTRDQKPLVLWTTSFALAGLLNYLRKNNIMLRLNPASRLMDTGGFKGSNKEISRQEMISRCRTYLGLAGRQIVNEYGMTELTSQFYNGQGGDWSRLTLFDPDRPQDLLNREGIVRVYDLANQFSCAFLETEDLARWRKGGLVITGRLPHSEPRGCSLSFASRAGGLS